MERWNRGEEFPKAGSILDPKGTGGGGRLAKDLGRTNAQVSNDSRVEARVEA